MRQVIDAALSFEQADVIVPNSDLISGQVTNWTLGNTRGRIKMQVGVACGSDVETVIKRIEITLLPDR
jgi:potassium-dependent mechanosensitive channel